jgi:hypothetical protein
VQLTRDTYRQFVHRNLSLYYSLYVALNERWPLSTPLSEVTENDIVVLAHRTKVIWWGDDHGKLPQGTNYSSAELIRAHSTVMLTGVFDSQTLPPGVRLRRLILTGVKLSALIRRNETDLMELINRADEIVCSFGERARRDSFGESLSEINALIDARPGLGDNPWIIEQRALGDKGFATEYHLGTLAFLLVYGDRVKVEHTEWNDNVQHLYVDDSHLVVVNAPAVKRLVGYDRPTSASAMQAMMEIFPIAAPADDEELLIGLLSGGPHTVRVPLDAAIALWNQEVRVPGEHEGEPIVIRPFAQVGVYALGSSNPEFTSPPVNVTNDRRDYATILALGELARFLWKATGQH